MSAQRGWIGDPQPSVEWRDSHYSREADRISTKQSLHPLHGLGRSGELPVAPVPTPGEAFLPAEPPPGEGHEVL